MASCMYWPVSIMVTVPVTGHSIAWVKCLNLNSICIAMIKTQVITNNQRSPMLAMRHSAVYLQAETTPPPQ